MNLPYDLIAYQLRTEKEAVSCNLHPTLSAESRAADESCRRERGEYYFSKMTSKQDAFFAYQITGRDDTQPEPLKQKDLHPHAEISGPHENVVFMKMFTKGHRP